MIKLTIYLIEDNLSFQRKIYESLKKNVKDNFGFIEFEIISIKNVIEFYKNIEKQNFISTNIFIIDIDLNTYFDGILLGKKIREYGEDSKIMYLTSFENKAIEIINQNISPEGYILKSQNIDNVVLQIINNLEKIIPSYTNTDSTLLINNGYQQYVLTYKEILYITIMPGMRNSLLLKSNSQEIFFSNTLSRIKKELTSPPFILNLKSFVINFDAIIAMNRTDGTIIFRNDEELYIGKQAIKKIEIFQKGDSKW